jgi:putative Mn2+ efflux pump MntP
VLTLLVLSFSVAADATAVAIAASVRGITMARGLAMALLFGAAQALMAGIGWAGGSALGGIWSAWDHWVALVLLSAAGVKMIREAFAQRDEGEAAGAGLMSLLVLAIATSLDALAVGVSLPALGAPAGVALAMIGAVTLLLSAAGVALGRYLGRRFGRLVEVAGGVGLIAIGIRIVIEHTR